MRIKIKLLLVLFFNYALIAQQHDKNIFQTVRDYSNRQSTVRLEYDYAYDTLTYLEIPRYLNMYEGGICMSDSSGNMLFYSNGIQINDSTYSMMENGDSLNFTGLDSDWYFFDLNPQLLGYYPESSYSNPIPLPGKENQYLFIHHPSFFDKDFRSFKTHYSRIDMEQNLGSGAVVEKNVELHGESQCAEFCKHANGIDWWMITADIRSDTFFVFLINDEGIIGPQIIKTGTVPNQHSVISGQYFSYHKLRISPLGNFLISVHEFDIDLFSFDRCTGEIQFLQNIRIPNEPGIENGVKNNQLGGCEFSACGNYAYVQNRFVMYQITLDRILPTAIPLSMTYEKQPNLIRLPNDKILLYSSFVINEPYRPFVGLISEPCQPNEAALLNYTLFDHHLFFSPYVINGSIPNFPNYRLPKITEYVPNSCRTEFFLKELNAPLSFNYNGVSYNKLLRHFKTN